ncbi:ovarian cancer G-protein coupled receptor 1-like [Plectropomus leopardus]|uniref:ovarian cancer G-protein coupled receptor 1-like n=1 Tax=Plectropomus leopardus TaxID=160734 RepID=UPI001C4AD7AB|nr:ovarian cancer G-protein coupled receptor 1-like [Plectropomus leopardus]
MEDFNMNGSSQDRGCDYTYITFYYNQEAGFIIKVVTSVTFCIGLPLTLMAIYALYSQVQSDHVAPIYVINLLISDLIQHCCLIVEVAQIKSWTTFTICTLIYYVCVGASVGFMVCVALERYLVIVFPLWYRFRRTIRVSVLVCVAVWAFPVVSLLSVFWWKNCKAKETIVTVYLLLPLPLLVFFLGGTLRGLSASVSVPSDEKRRIVGMLVLVLLIYTLLFLPTIILLLVYGARDNDILRSLFPVFFRFSPLADLVLYIFMKKGVVDRLLASVCCFRADSNDVSGSVV